MLIAIMGDTFDKASEVKEQSALKEKIDILADYVVVVGRESAKEKNPRNKKYRRGHFMGSYSGLTQEIDRHG